jgi:hypothetical protein
VHRVAVEIAVYISAKCLRLAKETSSDIAHISLLEFVVLATHLVDADVLECGDDSLDIEAHGDEAVDELLVVSVVSTCILAQICGVGLHTYAAILTFSSFSLACMCFFLIDSAVAPPLPSAISFFGAPACMTDHSLALCSNSAGFRISIPATSASCGSFGSGVLSRDWREIRADLMVRTGDHCDDSVSKQMAPYRISM